MKSFIALLIFSATFTSAFAQTAYNTVTINYNGQNKHLLLDGKAYTNSAVNNGSKFTIVVNDLAPGRHTLVLQRNNSRRNTNTAFTLRNNYDLNINIAGDGSVQLQETYRKRGTTVVGTAGTPMSAASYNVIAKEIRSKMNSSAKVNALNIAFANSDNYFTTSQVRRLIQMVSGEALRLQLAKASVRSITDMRNIYSLNNLFARKASRNEFADYIRNYNAGDVSGTGNTSGVNAMSDGNFSTLYNQVRNTWQAGAKLNMISNAFASTYNHFSTSQVVQLIQLLPSEAERLQAAKASYHSIIDQNNFTQVYTLLSTQASRNDLANYVRSIGGAVTYEATPAYRTPMSDANFNTLLEDIRIQWLPGAKKRAVLTAFANADNNFTVYQAAQLVQLDNDEPDRLDMAKASIRSITDPENIALLYNIFTTQSRRDELAEYVRVYNNTYGIRQ